MIPEKKDSAKPSSSVVSFFLSQNFFHSPYAYALLSEKDPNKAGKILARFEKCAGSYPYPCEIEGERELIAIAGGMKP